MKKLFFSAVALVAFSSVSMGNTIDQSKVDCAAVKSSTIIYCYNQGLSPAEANEIANAVFEQCIGMNDKSIK